MEKQKEYLAAAFTANGSQLDAKSVHLALCGADGVWKILNFGIGVLFAEADFSTGKTAGETMVLDSPTLQRLENGKIGVTARLYTAQGEERGAVSWETADLVRFERLPESLGADGLRTVLQLDGEGTVSASVLALTWEEAAYLEKKFGMVHSVSVDPVEVRLSVQDTALAMPPLTARYSDGSTEEIPVVWDEKALSAVRLGSAGTYEVPGQAVVKEYNAPLVRGVADPVIRRIGEMYYLIGTNEFTEGKDLWIRRASSIEGLADAEKSCIFRATESGDHRQRQRLLLSGLAGGG